MARHSENHRGGRHSGKHDRKQNHRDSSKGGGKQSGSGFFDSLFDVNHDGKVDGTDFFLMQQMRHTKRADSTLSPFAQSVAALQDEDNDWRLEAEDGDAYGLDPYDFESEEEYAEALEEAEESAACGDVPISLTAPAEPWIWEPTVTLEDAEAPKDAAPSEGVPAHGAAPSQPEGPEEERQDPNGRSRDAARMLAYYARHPGSIDAADQRRCQWILHGECVAARYMTHSGRFLFAQALKENFSLPISISDEDESREHDLHVIFRKTARYDIPLTLEMWQWILEEFLPHMDGLEKGNLWNCTQAVLSAMEDYPSAFLPAFKARLVEDTAFSNALMQALEYVPSGLSDWVVDSLRTGAVQEAVSLLTPLTENPHLDGDDLERLLVQILLQCKIDEEIETIERFRDFLLPIFLRHGDAPMRSRQEEWEDEIAACIFDKEEQDSKYRYSRRNAWRIPYRDQWPDPCQYDSEAAYLAARAEEEARWKGRYRGTELYGLDIDQYTDEQTFLADYRAAKKARTDADRAGKEAAARQLWSGERPIETFAYCSVLLFSGSRAYSYLTAGLPLAIGDQVVVPVGADNQEVMGVVASIEQHTRLTAPYPVENTKAVLRKVGPPSESGKVFSRLRK